MKCEVTSNTTHDLLISKERTYKSYKEICNGEPKKVNLGFWGNDGTEESGMKVENNTLVQRPKYLHEYINGRYASMSLTWEVLVPFFSNHNIEPNWLDCNKTAGWYDEDLGGWTGCMGKV